MAQRYQREIEEILGQAGEEGEGAGSDGSKPPRSPRRVARAPRRRLGRLVRPTPGRLLLAGIVLLILAVVLNALDAPGVRPFFWASVVLFVFAYVAYFTRPRRTVERRWRGQPMDDPQPAGPLSRLWRWITGG
ncbi:MAG: DUF2207 domain-containing protein [Chloroflexi bacterium]|nr:DUF2207 domain-containing protein [Chloroflexota bacterium]MYF64497.1 DUF2207 domain-containing protein [Chloroflexota bacterium]MYK34063.1 DUF2207 domain-containing protein [Chloroflexota bacterium]